MKPTKMIAAAITRERNRKGLSLSALADRAGLAKSTLSQLEAGHGNPSVETLWAIAGTLDIPLSYLFETAAPQVTLIRADDGPVLISEQSDFAATLLADCPPGRRRDLYRTRLQQGGQRRASPHPRGTIEHAFVAEGRVRIGPDSAVQDLGPGDYYRYPGDIDHGYEALSDTALILLVMETPG